MESLRCGLPANACWEGGSALACHSQPATLDGATSPLPLHVSPTPSQLLRFNQPVARVDVGNKVAVDQVLAFSPESWADNYTGTWLSSLLLLVTVTGVPPSVRTDPTLRAATAVGALRVTVRPSGELTSEDGSSAPSSASTLVTSGSWGDVVCDGSLHVYSQSAVVVAFLPPAGATYTPANYTLTVSSSAAFPAGALTRAVPVSAADSVPGSGLVLPSEAPAGCLRFVVPSLPPGEPVYVRVAAAVPSLPVEVTRALPRAVVSVAWPIGAPGGSPPLAFPIPWENREGARCWSTKSAKSSAFPTRAWADIPAHSSSRLKRLQPGRQQHGPATTPNNDPSLQAIHVGKHGRPPYPHHRKRCAN